MNDIILIAPVRQNSTRVRNKLTRPFGDTALIGRALELLEKLNFNGDFLGQKTFSRIAVPVCRDDKTLWNLVHSYRLDVIERDRDSIKDTDDSPARIHSYLNNCDEEYVMWLNACFPFLQPSTVLRAAKYFLDHKDTIKSLSPVIRRYNQFWDIKTSSPINNKEQILNTSKMTGIYETSHCFFIYNREYMLENDRYWDCTPGNPYLYELSDNFTTEFLDVDTERDFIIAEAVYNEIFSGRHR